MIKYIISTLILSVSLPSFANQSCVDLFTSKNPTDVIINELYDMRSSLLNSKNSTERALLREELLKKEAEILNSISMSEYRNRIRGIVREPVVKAEEVHAKKDPNSIESILKRVSNEPVFVDSFSLKKEDFFKKVSDDLKYVVVQSRDLVGRKPREKYDTQYVIYERTKNGLKEVYRTDAHRIEFSPLNNYLIVIPKKRRSLKIFDLNLKKEINFPQIKNKKEAYDLVFSQDESQIAYVETIKPYLEHIVHLYDVKTGSAKQIKSTGHIVKTHFVGRDLLVIYDKKKSLLYDSNFKIKAKTDIFKNKIISSIVTSLDNTAIHVVMSSEAREISYILSLDAAILKVINSITKKESDYSKNITNNGQFLVSKVYYGGGNPSKVVISFIGKSELIPVFVLGNSVIDYYFTKNEKYILIHDSASRDVGIWSWVND